MPLFGGTKRPKLDGLTKEEERLRDALNPEVLRRSGEKGVAGQMPAAAAILREKMEGEPEVFLWPYLLGWQMLSMRHWDQAIDAFREATARDPKEIRGFYGAGNAFFEAAQTKQENPHAAGLPEELTVDNLFHESLRNFRQAMELAEERGDRDQLRDAISIVDKALAKKAGRL